MAVVRLSDAYVYPVYNSYMTLNSTEKTAFFESGIIKTSPLLNTIARGAGKTVEVPWWNDLDAAIEPDYTNDDPTDLATPDKITSGNMNARKVFLHKSWSSMDLVNELTGTDPIAHIRSRFDTWWMRAAQRRLIATTVGLVADNTAATDAAHVKDDMGIDISGGTGAAAIFNFDAVLTATYTMGDMAPGAFQAIVVHSAIMARMARTDQAQQIVYIPDSQGNLTVPTYGGLRVIVDDSMPKSGTGTDTIYTSVLVGTGAFGFGGANGQLIGLGEGTPVNPSYVDRIEEAGNGGGQEVIGERKTWILHPYGYSWSDSAGTPIVEFSPTLANLADPLKWTRQVPRRNVPFAWIKSKA